MPELTSNNLIFCVEIAFFLYSISQELQDIPRTFELDQKDLKVLCCIAKCIILRNQLISFEFIEFLVDLMPWISSRALSRKWYCCLVWLERNYSIINNSTSRTAVLIFQMPKNVQVSRFVAQYIAS